MSQFAEWTESLDLAPVSIWLEDYSGLKRLFARWRSEGVTDLRAHLRRAPQRVAECSACLNVLKVNQRTLELFEADDQAHLLRNLGRIFRDDMFEQLVEEMVQLWNGQTRFSSQTVNYTLSGRRLDILLNAAVLPGHEDEWARVLLSIEDVTERAEAQRKLALSEQYARGLFEHSPVSLWVEDFSGIKQLLEEVREQGIVDFRVFTDVHPEFVDRCIQEIRVIDVNLQTLLMFGATSRDDLLKNLGKVFPETMIDHFKEQLIDLWNGKTFQQREVLNHTLKGEPLDAYMQFSVLPGHEARWDLVLVSLTDITARKKAEAHLEYLGKHDPLTKLRNRAFFTDEINRLERCGPWPVSVVIADLNGLKLVNDSLGHAAGDELLQRAGEVLAKAVDKPMHAARIGGDEFAILMPSTDEHEVELLVQQLHALIELNNQFHNNGMLLSFSLGAATCRSGERIETAVNLADQRMYEDKRAFYSAADMERRKAQ
jgi:diguanylate cyclase (GGDEF)-like protein